MYTSKAVFPNLKMAKFLNIASSSPTQNAFYISKITIFTNIAPTAS